MDEKRTTMLVPSVFTGPRKYGESRTMMAIDFDKVYSEVYTVCRDAFEKQGHFVATAFVLQVNDEGKIGLSYPAAMGQLFQDHGALGDEFAARYMNFMIQYDAVDFVVLVTEAWNAPMGFDEETISASLHPDRQEVLMFNIMGKDCRALAACPLERDAGTAVATVSEPIRLQFVHAVLNIAEGRFIRPPGTVLH